MEQKLNSGIRFGAMILDYFIMTVVIMLFSIPFFVSSFGNTLNVTHELNNPLEFKGSLYFSILGMSLFFCKDCINGRSIAKRILKLQLVDNTTGQVASPLKCFIRNIFCIIWPIEGIVALINPSRRIGDLIAGTKLIPFDSSIERSKPKYGQIALSLILSCGLMLLFSLYIYGFHFKNSGYNYVESSYNIKDSKSLEQLYADSLGNSITADVRVYDKIENDSLKYVSIIFRFKENYFLDESKYDQITSKAIPLLYSKIPEKSFVGLLRFVYQSSGSTQYRTIPINWKKR